MSCCAPVAEGALAAVERPVVSAEELRLASRSLGGGVMQVELAVPDVHCGGCIHAVESTLSKLDGVLSARVNLSTRRVTIKYREGKLPPIVESLVSIGYPPHLFEEEGTKDAVLSELLWATGVAGFAAGNIMLLSVSVWSGAEAATRDLFHWISALIAIPALFYAGRIFFRSAWNAVLHGRTNMDVPISIGVILAYALSLYETIHSGPHAYFDGAVSLLFFLLIGRTLDHVMRNRARVAVTSLARLAPRGATVLHPDGSRDYVPLNEIEPGMVIAVAVGERIPVDGVVMEGSTDIDCSMATGESAPQPAQPGSDIRAGMLNLTHPITMKATAAAKDSFLAEMVRLMEAAESSRAAYRRLADRVSALYAPVVHLTALLTFIGWMIWSGGDWHLSITIAIAVLIITCPCALGLAVPMVQVVAARRLFEHGIMAKDGSAMERLANIDTAVFDKTGTLTVGEARLANAGEIDAEALAIAAALGARSNHPLSRAIAAAAPANTKPVQLAGITEQPGFGVEAKIGSSVYRLGRASWALSDDAAEGTVLARDGQLLASFRFENRLRQDAAEALEALRKRGIEVEIMSGDTRAQVEAIATKLGVTRYHAGVLPGEKAVRMAELAAEGRKVLMVGDGLNDAPALAAAYVSMAPATAADVGRNAADFVFLHESMNAVPFAHRVARRSGQLIRQNFGIAVVYNLIAVPIAILGYVTPLVAAVAMSGSSVIVVANALRLLRLGGGQKRSAAATARRASHKLQEVM